MIPSKCLVSRITGNSGARAQLSGSVNQVRTAFCNRPPQIDKVKLVKWYHQPSLRSTNAESLRKCPTRRLSRIMNRPSRSKGRLYAGAALVLAMWITAASAAAQNATASLTGTVSDEAGKVVGNAEVTLTSGVTRAARTTRTDSNGTYAFIDLPPGTYTLAISAASKGFETFEAKNTILLADRTVRADVVLRAGELEIQDDFGISLRVAQPTEVALTKLLPPVYPPIALTTRVWGDVDVVLGIGQQGNVESASVVSGPPLLSQAALNSAQQSQFKCVGCTEAVTAYHLFYSFRLGPTTHCTTTTAAPTTRPEEPRSSVTQSLNHVTVFDTPIGTCDFPVELGRKVRAAKCLYLWRCGVRTS
jgi:hypothetical protein